MTVADSLIILLAPEIGEERAKCLLLDFIKVSTVRGRVSLAEHRSKVLAEAIEAARSEYLTDDTGTDEDAAYNQGVTDAIAAISALVESGAS